MLVWSSFPWAGLNPIQIPDISGFWTSGFRTLTVIKNLFFFTEPIYKIASFLSFNFGQTWLSTFLTKPDGHLHNDTKIDNSVDAVTDISRRIQRQVLHRRVCVKTAQLLRHCRTFAPEKIVKWTCNELDVASIILHMRSASSQTYSASCCVECRQTKCRHR